MDDKAPSMWLPRDNVIQPILGQIRQDIMQLDGEVLFTIGAILDLDGDEWFSAIGFFFRLVGMIVIRII